MGLFIFENNFLKNTNSGDVIRNYFQKRLKW